MRKHFVSEVSDQARFTIDDSENIFREFSLPTFGLNIGPISLEKSRSEVSKLVN